MEFNLWKSVLLDWVNSTGFLVQNYENLNDTNIETFFNAFKQQIKSTSIKSPDVFSFVKDYYKDFQLKLDEKNQVPVSEYVYFYSLFLHFACVLHADSGIQQICNNMVRKNQELIEKYLDYLFKVGKCERGIVQSAIEEAESCDLNMAQRSPITRNLQSILSSTSPQTPKSKLLNTWNLENRNLRAQLETERFERGYLEMQLTQCEKKLAKLDDDYKEAMTENNYLKKQIQTLDDHELSMQNSETDLVAKQFRRQIGEKEDELLKLTITYNEAKDDIEILKEKLQYAESQIKALNVKLHESFSEAESFKNQLEEREKMIVYVNNNNKELSDLLKELQSNSKKQDFDSSASYEMLNSTANELNSSSFCVMEENLASAVVDIRLIDQQKQNLALNESVNRLQSELSMIQEETTKLFKIMADSCENGAEPPSPDTILSKIHKSYTNIAAKNTNLSKQLKDRCMEIASLEKKASDFQSTINALNEKLRMEEKENETLLSQSQNAKVEIESLKTALVNCETQKSELNVLLADANAQLEQIQSEKRELIAKHYEHLRHIRSELEEKANNLNSSLDAVTIEKNGIQSKLEHVKLELNESIELAEKHKAEIEKIKNELNEEKAARDELQKECDSVQTKFSEITEQFVKAQDDLKEMQTKNGEMTEVLDQHMHQISQLKTDLGQSKEKIAEMQQTIASHVEKESQLTIEIETAKSEISQKIKDIEALNVEIKSLKDDGEKSASEIAALTESKSALKVELNKMTQENQRLEDELAQKKEQANQIQSELQERIETISNKEKCLQGDINGLKTECEAANKRIELLENEKKNYLVEIDVLTKSQAAVQKQFDDLTKQHVLMTDQLQQKVDQMNAIQVEYQQKSDELSGEIKQLQDRINSTTSDLNDANAHIKSLQEEKVSNLAEICSLDESQSALRTKLDELTQENQHLTNKLAQNTEEASQLLCKLQQKIESLSSEEKRLQSEIDGLKTDCDAANKRIELLEEEKKGYVAEIGELTESQATAMNQFDALTKQHTLLVDELQRNEEKMAAMQAEHQQKSDELLGEKKQLQNQIDEVTKDLETASERVTSLEEEKVKNLTEIDSLAEAKTLIKKELDEITEKHQLLNDDFMKKEEQMVVEQEEYQQKINQHLAQEERLLNEIGKLKTEHLNAFARIASLEQDKTDYVAQILEIRSTCEQKCQSIQDESSAVQELMANELKLARETAESRESKLKMEIQTIKEHTDGLQNKLSALETDYQTQTEKFAEVNEKHSQLETQLNTKIDDLSGEKERLSNELTTLTDENQNLISVSNGKSTELERVNGQLLELTAAKNATEESLKELESKLEESTKLVESLKDEAAALKLEKESLNTKIGELNQTIDEKMQELNNEKEQFELKYKEINEKMILVETEKRSIEENLKQVQTEADDQLKKYEVLVQEKKELEEKVAALAETNSQNMKVLADYESKTSQIEELTSEKVKLDEQLKTSLQKLEEVSKILGVAQSDLATANTEKNSMVSKVIQLNRSIDEITQQMLHEKEEFSQKEVELNEQLSSALKGRDALQEKWDKLDKETAEQSKEYEAVKEEKKALDVKVEEYTKTIQEMKESLTKLEDANKVLADKSADSDQLVALNEQLVQTEKKYNEMVKAWTKEKDEITQNMNIYRAKLMKERETAEQKEAEYKSMRNGFEEKLEKMKERMKFLYKEEMAKVQEKHEKLLNDLANENRRFIDKNTFLEERIKEFSSQIYALNDEKLQLLKEHEIMKSKLRTYEIGSTLNGGNTTSSASKFFDKIRGSNFRMEDEEGELFDNTYLDELKKESGRESLTLEEIQRRNSMVPPHLRSSYMPQFAVESKPLDDSMFSTQSESRRGTAYKKPGPPTPSKNGGRYSLGGGEMPRGDVLREQNGERPSLGGTAKPSKKHTPNAFSRIFSTTKLKDEDKENGTATSDRNTLQNLQQKFFSTSTPRRRHARRSSLPKFDSTSFGLANNSVSTIEFKRTTDVNRLASLSRNLFAQTKRVSQKLLRSADKKATNTDSTPEYDRIHQDSTKLVAPAKKSFIKKRASLLKKKALRMKTQKEKRFDAYNRRRCIPTKWERAVDETYSIGNVSNVTGATYNKSGATYNLSTATYDLEFDEQEYESEILDFQEEVNEHHGPIEITVENVDDEVDFEKLCNVKQSDCPFVSTETASSPLLLPCTANTKTLLKSQGEACTSLSPQSNSNFSSNSTTRLSSHCARICWNQQKIPKITTYKAEKKSFDNNNNSSARSHHLSMVRSFQLNMANGWQDLPTFVQYYIIAITICLIANLYIQFIR